MKHARVKHTRLGEAISILMRPQYGDYSKKDSGVSWQEIKGMRNILVHVYWGIDDEIGWSAIEKLPALNEKFKIWIREKEQKHSKDGGVAEPTKGESRLKELLEKKKITVKTDEENPVRQGGAWSGKNHTPSA